MKARLKNTCCSEVPFEVQCRVCLSDAERRRGAFTVLTSEKGEFVDLS